MLRRLVAVAAFAAMGAAASSSFAAPVKSSSLSWTRLPGAEECLATREFARAVERKLGRSVFVSAADAELAVEGRVERAAPKGWRATIVVTRADGVTVGRRELHVAGGKCALLDDSLVLVVALMIDPDAGGAREAPRPPAPAPAPTPEPRVIVVEVPVPAPAPRWSGDVGLEGTALVAGIGGVVPGARLTASALPPGLVPLEVDANVSALARTSDGALAVRFLYAGVAVCPTLLGEPGAVALSACGGVEGGFLHVASSTGDRDDALFAGSARARIVVPLFGGPSWSIDARAEAGLLAFFRRPSYSTSVLDPTALTARDQTLFRLPALGGTVAVGLGFELR